MCSSLPFGAWLDIKTHVFLFLKAVANALYIGMGAHGLCIIFIIANSACFPANGGAVIMVAVCAVLSVR